MHPLYEKFCKLCEELAIKSRIDPILAELYSERTALEAVYNELKQIMVQEQADVERLNEVNIALIFYTVIGQKNKKLEKEKSEALDAEERFSEIQNQLAELDEKIKKYERELRTVRGCDLRYGRLLPQILDEIKAIDSPAAKAVLDTFNTLSRLEEKVAKLDEAIELSRDALKNAREAARYIGKADYFAQHSNIPNRYSAGNYTEINCILSTAQTIVQELCLQIKKLDASLVAENLHLEISIKTPVFSDFHTSEWKSEIDSIIPQLEKVHEKLIPARDRWAKRVSELRIELQEQIKAVLE